MSTPAGTREFAQLCLEQGHCLSYSAWHFTPTSWSCGDGCCNDDGLDVEDVMSTLDRFCDSHYEKVNVLPKRTA